jgi:DNA-binding XRE family transcriptional regulator
MTQTIRILAQTTDTVTIGRSDFESLVRTAEDAEDLAALAAHDAEEAQIGRATARKDYLTADEAEKLLNGENPIRVWREKRGLSQRALAGAAGMQPGYLAEIETERKPGSVDALRRIATVLGVPMGDLLTREQRMREPDYGPVVLKLTPMSIGVEKGRRGTSLTQDRYETVAAALRQLSAHWDQLRNQTPSLWDAATGVPILDCDDIFRRMEPETH